MTETTETPPAAKPADSVRSQIQSLINGSGPGVVEQVITHFVDIEKARRSKLLIDGLTRLTEAESAVAAIKPDHRVFDTNGAVIQVGFSQDQKGKLEKARKKLDRLTTAVNKALADGGEAEFKALEEALKQSD